LHSKSSNVGSRLCAVGSNRLRLIDNYPDDAYTGVPGHGNPGFIVYIGGKYVGCVTDDALGISRVLLARRRTLESSNLVKIT